MVNVMSRVERMLVPIDFSRYTEAVLVAAANVAKQHDASVDVVHVWRAPFAIHEPWGALVTTPAPAGDLATGTHRALDDACDGLRRRGVARVQGRLLEGTSSHTILGLIAAEGFDLVVMGNHGRTGLAHAYLGSVTERVLRRSRVPVLVVPTSDGEPDVARGKRPPTPRSR